jgi:hypothetical protein
LLVKSPIAVRQVEAEKPVPPPISPDPELKYPLGGGGSDSVADGGSNPVTLPPVTPPIPPKVRKTRRFHGSISLDANRLGRDAGRVNDEVIQHLVALLNSNAEITLEIAVDVPDGIPDNVIRTVSENCRTLKFKSHGFEDE